MWLNIFSSIFHQESCFILSDPKNHLFESFFNFFDIFREGHNNNNNKMRWCTGAVAKLIFQLFCVWRSRGRRKGDPNINVVGKTIKRKNKGYYYLFDIQGHIMIFKFSCFPWFSKGSPDLICFILWSRFFFFLFLPGKGQRPCTKIPRHV